MSRSRSRRLVVCSLLLLPCLASTAQAELLVTLTTEADGEESVPVSVKLWFSAGSLGSVGGTFHFITTVTPADAGAVFAAPDPLLAQLADELTQYPLPSFKYFALAIEGTPPDFHHAFAGMHLLVTGSPVEPYLYTPQPWFNIVRHVPVLGYGLFGYGISGITQEISPWALGDDGLYYAVETVNIYGSALPVPEPAGWLLMGVGILLLGVRHGRATPTV